MQVGISGPVPDGLTVIETMRREADGRIRLWPLHLCRLRRDCRAVGFPLDEGAVEAALAGLPRGAILRARLAIGADGQPRLLHQPLDPGPGRWTVMLSGHRLDSADPWLRIKSSHRPVHDAVRAALPSGVDEAILLNRRGEMCEGTITNLFLARGGRLLTPPLASGLLPGVLRQALLDSAEAEEAVLSPADLHDAAFFMGNALRGLIPAQLSPGF